jgi:hypothetical protein
MKVVKPVTAIQRSVKKTGRNKRGIVIRSCRVSPKERLHEILNIKPHSFELAFDVGLPRYEQYTGHE